MTPEEFRKIVLPEGRRLYALAFRFLNSREEAEDAVQEVMMKLWSERNVTREYSNVAAWCTTVTRNLCIDILRKRKMLKLGDPEEAEAAASGETDLIKNHEQHEAAGLITLIISRMGEPIRSAVIMRDLEGYSYEETAETLGTNVAALRTMISRARKHIREEMIKVYGYGT
ncbi:MAG: RNA polymerase sigma factor [Bacteroidales bacterium]|jgi:RNA polymerase sigma-70 factor (ECF subfamily)|nr:RNA polymerase sigma factor [Bacteroidales bacterium]